MTSIRLSRSASLVPTAAGVLLRSDLGTFQITGAGAGAFLAQLAPLLDGSRDRDAVQAALGAYSPASVARFLDILAERGLLEEAPGLDAPGDGQRALFQRWSGSAAEAMDRLASARVLVAGAEPWGDAAAAELGAAGVGAIERFDAGSAIEAGGEGCLVVAAVSPEDAAEAERIARAAHHAGVRTLWSHLDEGHAVLGPLTVPGRTACPVCAAAGGVNPPLGARPAPGPRAAIMARILGHLLAMEAVKVVSGYTPSSLGGRVLIQDTTTFETRIHTLARLPWCRVCGRG